MATIIAGRFEQQTEIDHTIDALLRAGFSRERIATFYLNPAGQHATYPIGGDHDKSPGAKETTKGVAAGAAAGAAVGLAATPFLGPVGGITGGLVGAHVGGLVGGLSQMKESGDVGDEAEDPENAIPARQAGMFIAVELDDEENLHVAADALKQLGATDLERAEGSIVGGDWKDFDPSVAPVFLQDPAPQQRRPNGPTQRA